MTKQKLLCTIFAIAAAFLSAAILLVCLGGVPAGAAAYQTENEDLKFERITDSHPYLNNGYLERYGVPTAKFRYENNGGAEQGAPFDNAFDRNFGSIWRSEMQLDKNDPSTINNVVVTFLEPTEVDRIIYQADYGWYNRGSFTKLRLSYVPGNEEGEKAADFEGKFVALQELAVEKTSDTDPNVITIKKPVKAKAIKLEWVEIHDGHRRCAAASEIVFLQPESKDVEAVQNLFEDYAQLKLADIDGKKVTKEDVEALRKSVMHYSTYDTELSYLLNRAEQVLAGTVSYDARREMGTDPSSANVLLRHGDVAGYARGTAKMIWFGTNRQATGISAAPGEEIVVYVTGNADDPLPTLVCTQFWGAWSSWKSGEYKLRLGKNIIRPGNYLQPGFTTDTGDSLPAGGPIYLVNPYEAPDAEMPNAKVQSDNVKVYIEGGTLFPIFRMGGDEDLYRSRLEDYARSVETDREEAKNPSGDGGMFVQPREYRVVDVTEIVSKNIIVTVRATAAKRVYIDGTFPGPQTACEGWDTWLEKLLISDGLVLEKDKEQYGGKYDPHATWLNCNIRLQQPYGAAYAFGEHVGIQVSWEVGALTGQSFGWGYAHELGHMMDISERIVSECSNNMLSKYDETVISRIATRGDFAKTTAALAPDDHVESYWNTNRGNFIFWWLIESFRNGYWPTLENHYRYTAIPAEYKLNATEKQVYLSSLAVGFDLSYYFERWGYNLSTSDMVFSSATATQSFKTLMAEARKNGLLTKPADYQPKIWYLDAAEWWATNGGNTAIYTDSVRAELEAVTRSDAGYNLLMNSSKASDPAHLGYEIWEGKGKDAKVIAFTYDGVYTDTTEYAPGYVPTYSVVAFDRALQQSAKSEEVSVKSGTTVARNLSTNTDYTTLREAVNGARAGQTIAVVADCYATGLIIDKAITVVSDGGTHTLTRGGAEPLFTVTETGKLTLGKTGGGLVLDGRSLQQSSPLLLAEGSVSATDCTFRNNFVRRDGSHGGAVTVSTDSNTTVKFTNCIFEHNTARLGGAVYDRRGNAAFEKCTFKQNEAIEGGAIHAAGVTIILTECNFEGNIANMGGLVSATLVPIGGAITALRGAVIKATDCSARDNRAVRGGAVYAEGSITFTNGTYAENTAEEGAAFYLLSSGSRRSNLEGLTIADNTAEGAAAVYLEGSGTFKNLTVGENKTAYALYMTEGTVDLAGGEYAGDLFKSTSLTLGVRDAMPHAKEGKILVFTNAELVPDSEEIPTLLLLQGTGGYQLPEHADTAFASNDGTVARDGNSLVVSLTSIAVTFKADSITRVHNYLPGRELVFDNNSFDETTYVLSWTKDGGTVYEVGDSVIVEEPMTFVAKTAKKVKISYTYPEEDTDDADFNEYVIPGESYLLPAVQPQKFVLGGWERGGEVFATSSRQTAESDVTYSAVLTRKLAVTYRAIDKEGHDVLIATRYYPYGALPEAVGFDSYEGEGVLDRDAFVGDSEYHAGYRIGESGEEVDISTFFVYADTTLYFIIEDFPIYVLYIFDFPAGEENLTYYDTVKYNEDYTVDLEAVPFGYHTTSVKLNGEDIDWNQLDGLVIPNVTDPVIGIEVVLQKNVYNVTWKINNEEILSEEKVTHGSEIVLEEPEGLPEGYHFTSYEIGKQMLVYDDTEGIYRMQDTTLNIMLGQTVTITEDTVINVVVYIEGRETVVDPGTSGGTTDPGTTPGGSENPGTNPGGTTDPGTTPGGTTDPGTNPGGTTDPGTSGSGSGSGSENPGTKPETNPSENQPIKAGCGSALTIGLGVGSAVAVLFVVAAVLLIRKKHRG